MENGTMQTVAAAKRVAEERQRHASMVADARIADSWRCRNCGGHIDDPHDISCYYA